MIWPAAVIWPAWLWAWTPVKAAIWLASRVTAAAGSFFVWKRYRARRYLWARIVLLNLLSWGALVLVFLWLR